MADEVKIDREGKFRGSVAEYSLQQKDTDDSNSVTLFLKLQIIEAYAEAKGDSGEFDWIDNGWTEAEVMARGTINLVKANGEEMNEIGLRQMEDLGWSGKFSDLADGSWEPNQVAFEVVEREYKGKPQYDATNFCGYDKVPGGGGLPESIEVSAASALDKKFHSAMKAKGSNKKIASKPKPPGKAAKKPPKKVAEPATETVPPEED